MSDTPDILKKIIARKEEEIATCKENISVQKMLDAAYKNRDTQDFYQALKDKADLKQNAVIAEIKKASPSKGVLRENFNPVEIAQSYQQAGAACLSVLTDKDFFQGDNQYLTDVRQAVSIPVLRKEFIIDPYQIYESRVLGADCILLIAACLSDEQMEDLAMRAIAINMDVLVEVHNIEELLRTQQLRLPMIGINNRNLRSFDVSLNTTIELMKAVQEDTLIITESGILTGEDVAFMRKNDIYSFLVGEAFMRQDNPGIALQEMFK
ncbi:MAG: indole-3-glycerol phosphate synthase TrpC [Gammaproteobacteria bacterium]|uniref:Indole-3-glycerol phosphate synthase n=1 Tax=endosymbiont of Bathymodiolus septemdierum str. Myojin knoll TaxID=1303921 RepID=A0A0P0USC7_9GAMM|nr:indole-3-glycerol phosphate synthase TrpC [Bathymodiolus septemdierum thioautotrophic gill symbiont]RUA06353.1 MAG: indole-3-glycerol phosphate synthase TrpC [Gammaproteobacteria bacterium]BAS68197.1 indole-3-glycerol phosphate synthase [endosymbiont of Bathymodiolus septemdierum str. Myojin knoll]